MEQLYVFGTGNATVTRYYNTCFAIKNPENHYFMVDTGGGNGILRILEDMQVSIPDIHHIFITHEHTDHLLGIVWMIRVMPPPPAVPFPVIPPQSCPAASRRPGPAIRYPAR